jgi:hypothetical protein
MSSEPQCLAHLVGEFPGLRLASDPVAVTAEIARLRPMWLPSGSPLQAEIRKTYVHPGRFVQIVYHFHCEEPHPMATWVVGRVEHCDVLPAPDLDLPGDTLALEHGAFILTSFTADRHLPALASLVQHDWAREYFARHQHAFAPDCKTGLKGVAVLPLKYNPGKRAVLRCTLEFDDRIVHTWAKCYADDKGAWSAAVQQDVHCSLQQRGRSAGVPAVYRYDADLHVTFQEDWPGEQLKKLCSRLDDSRLLYRLLEAAHELHAVRIPAVVKTELDTRSLLRTARGDVEDTARLVPGTAAVLQAVFETARCWLEEPGDRTPGFVHGSLLLSQVLLNEAAVGFLDFDSAAIGDCLRDVSELLTSAVYERWRAGSDVDALERFWDEAMHAAIEIYGSPMSATRATGYALAFLLGKTHQHLKSIKHSSQADAASLCSLLTAFARHRMPNDSGPGPAAPRI